MSAGCRFCPELAGEVRSSEFHELLSSGLPSRYIRQSDNFVVFPALGHIVPGHLLLTTKRHWLCMAQIVPTLFDELEGILAAARSRLMYAYGGDVLIYEHGQMSTENQCGACVDHAHLHIVPVPPGTDEKVRAELRREHREAGFALFEDLPAAADGGRGYLMIQDSGGRRFYYDAPAVPSQYLRKLTCEAMGSAHRWDWRQNLISDTVEGTIEIFGEVMSAVGEGWANVDGRLDFDRTVDGLTGAHNRGFLYEYLEREVARARRYDRPLSLVLFDVDGLRHINASHGHYVGDLVLKKLAARARDQIRKEEVLVRYAGEEFAVVLPETDRDKAMLFAERLRQVIGGEDVEVIGELVKLSISVGVGADRQASSADALIDEAADKLDQAKERGGDCIVG